MKNLPDTCKKIVGLDLSLTETGWCSTYSNKTPIVGTIATGRISGFERINFIVSEIDKIIGNPFPPDILVVMEDFSFGSKGQGVLQIGGLGYIVRYHLWQNGIPFVLVPPTSLKKFVTGKGNFDKNVVLKEIFKRWGADINNDNAGDAYVLYRIGAALVGWDVKLTDFQREVLAVLGKSDIERKES